jgi:tetratricopeptide (TPR) repeat protein
MSAAISTNIVRLGIAASLVAAAFAASLRAQSATRQVKLTQPSRSEHLRQWVEAIERHTAGENDEALAVFDTWRPDDFNHLTIDINTLLALVSNPSLRTFSYSEQTVAGRPSLKRAVYSGSDLTLILDIARMVRGAGVPDGAVIPPERLAKLRNRLLKRGAILHTDVALEVLLGNRSRARSVPDGLQEFTLKLPDGRSQGMAVDVGHWELARSLLDKVVPAAARDEFVRGWYTATAAYLASLEQLVPGHFTRGFHLFPDDADLLFFAGCLHESLAESRIQEAMQSASIPADVKFEVSSRKGELRGAENLFRKALKARPDHLETRIRLGRVLGLRGEHAEAEMLLRTAVGDATEPLLQYYARLFLGAEKEALGDRAQARDLYEGATVLYPEAQSPRLALSLISSVEGKHADALAMMTMALGLRGEARNDPWWRYHGSQGRNAPNALAVVYASVSNEDQR